MTAAGLIVLSVACLIAAVVGAILVTILDIRAERKWRHWDSMPGATSSVDEHGRRPSHARDEMGTRRLGRRRRARCHRDGAAIRAVA
jgi:hypothetical protein